MSGPSSASKAALPPPYADRSDTVFKVDPASFGIAIGADRFWCRRGTLYSDELTRCQVAHTLSKMTAMGPPNSWAWWCL